VHHLPPREAVYSERFDRERALIEPNFARFDDAFRYIEEQLLFMPGFGIQTPTEEIWVAPMQLLLDDEIVDVSIFYSFTDERVTFESIVREPAPSGP
jgi:hypothetical protein